jgi:hypothetical protein
MFRSNSRSFVFVQRDFTHNYVVFRLTDRLVYFPAHKE